MPAAGLFETANVRNQEILPIGSQVQRMTVYRPLHQNAAMQHLAVWAESRSLLQVRGKLSNSQKRTQNWAQVSVSHGHLNTPATVNFHTNTSDHTGLV